ncbi:hypothetical protein IMSAGC018_01329 [Lachnospiraceae bacterium]|nr:hypothetical protein IMSAGC018_01329 [Lachnospiraceae bacterium]
MSVIFRWNKLIPHITKEALGGDRTLLFMANEAKRFMNPYVSDGKLMETQTANYFSDIYPIDCAVLSANA